MRRGDEKNKKDIWKKKADKEKNCKNYETCIKSNDEGTILICILSFYESNFF